MESRLKQDEHRAEKDAFKSLCITMAIIFVVVCVVWSFIGY